MGASFFETPELVLDPSEAKQLAVAMARVAGDYARDLNPHVVSWAQLLMCLGGLYGTRIFAIRARHAAEGDKKPGPRVIDFNVPRPPAPPPTAPAPQAAPKTNGAPGAAVDAGPGFALDHVLLSQSVPLSTGE